MTFREKSIFTGILTTCLLLSVSSALPGLAQKSGAVDGAPKKRGPFALMKRVWNAPRVTQNPYGDGSNWTIEADKTEVLKDEKKYIARGHVRVYIDGQDANLKADEVTFDEDANSLEVAGNVTIERKGMVTHGQKYKFKINSEDYLVTVHGAEPTNLNFYSREGKWKH